MRYLGRLAFIGGEQKTAEKYENRVIFFSGKNITRPCRPLRWTFQNPCKINGFWVPWTAPVLLYFWFEKYNNFWCRTTNATKLRHIHDKGATIFMTPFLAFGHYRVFIGRGSPKRKKIKPIYRPVLTGDIQAEDGKNREKAGFLLYFSKIGQKSITAKSLVNQGFSGISRFWCYTFWKKV